MEDEKKTTLADKIDIDFIGFSNPKIVNDESLAKLSDEKLKQVGDILKKAGY